MTLLRPTANFGLLSISLIFSEAPRPRVKKEGGSESCDTSALPICLTLAVEAKRSRVTDMMRGLQMETSKERKWKGTRKGHV